VGILVGAGGLGGCLARLPLALREVDAVRPGHLGVARRDLLAHLVHLAGEYHLGGLPHPGSDPTSWPTVGTVRSSLPSETVISRTLPSPSISGRPPRSHRRAAGGGWRCDGLGFARRSCAGAVCSVCGGFAGRGSVRWVGASVVRLRIGGPGLVGSLCFGAGTYSVFSRPILLGRIRGRPSKFSARHHYG